MNLLIQELRDGETLYEKGPEEGELFAIKRPPTRLALQAANRIETLEQTIQNLGTSYNALMSSHEQLINRCNTQSQYIQELTEKLQAGTQTPQSTTTSSQLPESETNLEQTTKHQS